MILFLVIIVIVRCQQKLPCNKSMLIADTIFAWILTKSINADHKSKS